MSYELRILLGESSSFSILLISFSNLPSILTIRLQREQRHERNKNWDVLTHYHKKKGKHHSTRSCFYVTFFVTYLLFGTKRWGVVPSGRRVLGTKEWLPRKETWRYRCSSLSTIVNMRFFYSPWLRLWLWPRKMWFYLM